MNKLQELDLQLTSKRKALAELYQSKPDRNFSDTEIDDIRARTRELDALGTQRELELINDSNTKALHDDNRVVRRVSPVDVPEGAPGGELDPAIVAQLKAMGLVIPKRVKSLGEALIEHESAKNFNPRQRGSSAAAEVPALSVKATFTETAATLTGYERPAGMVLLGQQMPTVADLLASGQTTQPTIRYVKEDTFTNAATTVAEGATKPEASFDTSEVDAPVRKIGVTAKVSEELYADFPMLRDYINNRLVYMVQITEDANLLTGDGNAPNILGILNTAGILTQAKGADPVPDAIFKAMIKVMSQGFFNPDGIVMHPNDWQDVRLLRDTATGYLLGPITDPGIQRLFGVPVVVTTGMTENTALVGAFRLGGQVWRREGIRVETTNSNEDDFKKNLIAIRVEERLALTVYRPKAFATVTGI
jgi:hypothetical protein